MDAVWLVLMIATGIALLLWSRRLSPLRCAEDGSWFDCRIQIVERDGRNGSWIEAQGEIDVDRVLVRYGPLRGAQWSDPLAVVGKSEHPPARLAVYVLSDLERHIAVGVPRHSPADDRLQGLLDDR